MAANGLTGSGILKRNTAKLLILAVLFFQLTAAFASLSSSLQGPDWASFWLCLLLGLSLSWLLASLHQPVYRAVILLIAAGFLYILLVPGSLDSKLALFFLGGFRWLRGLFPFHRGEKLDILKLTGLLRALVDSVLVVIQRSQVWIIALTSGKPIFDPLAAMLAWNGLIWIGASWAGWMVESRKNALLAVLPAVMLSLGTLSMGQHMSNGLYLMLGLTILLLAVVQQNQRQKSWRTGGIAFPANKGGQILNFALLVTILLVFLSASLSSLSAQRIRSWIDELRKPAPQSHSLLAKSLGILPEGTEVPDEFQAVRNPGLPRDHLIGSGPELSSRVVMTVKVENLAALSQGNQPLPLYWRGWTYDIYTGHGWSSSETTDYSIAANAPVQGDHAADHIAIKEEFFPVESLGGTVYATGDPISINHASEVGWRSPGDLFGIQISSNSEYEVISLVPVADESALRQSGVVYPDWVKQRFLALPAEVPDRVKTLAIRLTASGLTPYDRALAIEDYLRTFPYTLDISYPPPQLDVTDYFLFDLKKGYCDYFATAMVVLARGAGIPARLVIGYAPGTYILNSKRFSVSEADAHSWAELYFSGYGWIPFEATPSRPSLDRSIPPVIEPASPGGNLPEQATGQGQKNILIWLQVPVAMFGLVTLLGMIWFILDGVRLYLLPEPVSVAVIYRKMKRFAGRLGISLESGATPYELSTELCIMIDRLTVDGFPVSTRTRLTDDTRMILDAIVQFSYRVSGYSGRKIIRRWLKLRGRLYLVWGLRFVDGIGIRRHSQRSQNA